MTKKTRADAHITISIRLPVSLVKELKQLSLTPEHEGRYQILIRHILSDYVHKHKAKKR